MDADLAIVGGGLTGLCAAHALSLLGFHVIVFTPAESIHTAQRVYGLSAGSLRRLASWNININENQAAVIEQVEYWNARRQLFSLDSKDLSRSCLGVNIAHTTFKAMLQAAVCNSRALVKEACVSALEKQDNGWSLQSEDGQKITVPFIIGADGSQSLVRHVQHIDYAYYHQFNQHALALMLEFSRDSQPRKAFQISLGDKLVGILPCSAGHRYVVITGNSAEMHSLAQDVESLLSVLKPIQDIIGPFEVMKKIGCYPLFSYHVSQQVNDSSLLLGLSAKSFHPAAALGFNQTLFEIAQLVSLLENKQPMCSSFWKKAFTTQANLRSQYLRFFTSCLATSWCRDLGAQFTLPNIGMKNLITNMIL